MSSTVLKRIGENATGFQSAASDINVEHDGARMGGLSTEHGYLPLTALGYRSQVRSLSVRTEISQTFYNPYDVPMEATYIFPLDSGVAVTDCHLLVGDRVIRADLEERSVARQRYRKAVAAGHRAALLEENRSETFSLKVGNIAAGEAVQIRLVTVGKLPLVGTEWTLRLPLVVAPRYTSGVTIANIPSHSTSATGIPGGTQNPTDEVPDAALVTPPVLVSGFRNKILLDIQVDLDLKSLRPDGDWESHLQSSLHSVLVDDQVESCRVKLLHNEPVNRDFILRGHVAASDVTLASRMSPPTEAERGTFSIDVVPPPRSKSDHLTPARRIVFLLDRSGSMSGWKFRAAQRGLSNLIQSLGAQDQFEVIAFDHDLKFFNKRNLATASDQTTFAATRWLNRLNEAGGTEMAQALDAGLEILLSDAQQSDAEPVASSIVLITDGQISGEDHLMARLKNLSDKQRPRIYTLGVDRAVNASVLRRISNATNGTFELVETEQRLSERLDAFAAEIGTPVLTDIKVTTDSDENCEIVLETTDLYSGRAVSVYGRSAESKMKVNLWAKMVDGSDWRQSVDVASNGCVSEDLISLWGRQQVRYLEDQYAIKNSDDEVLRQRIIDVSLSANVLSRFTAYIAVDESEIVEGGPLNRVTQPSEYPEGWEHMALRSIAVEDRLSTETRLDLGSDMYAGKPANLPSFSAEMQEKACRFLIRDGVLSEEQFKDAGNISKTETAQAAIDLGYAAEEEVMKAIAEAARVPYVDLSAADLQEDVTDLLPEAVARENDVIAVGIEDGCLVVATAMPFDLSCREKLRFILSRDIRCVVSTPTEIRNAINFMYGQIEGESADSMLQEFTDTKIDFTETVEMEDELLYGCMIDSEAGEINEGDCVIYESAIEAPMMRKSRSKSSSKPKRQKTIPAIERLLDMMFAELYQLKGSLIRIRLSEEGVPIEYGIQEKAKLVLKERDRLTRRQWKPLLEAIDTRSKSVQNEDGRWVTTLTWKAADGSEITFAVEIDVDAAIVELTVVP